ncbi:hypothetical protein JIN85_18405 [Luteolibacter pohnpeiensis]|uniref:Restriction endonuclease type I HsdR N-terminal domain-containing protein n=1 Tax=Luteolibacter pohnpeiensis TaxID=454153 RepID=A0A934S7Z6_9BACT|nr:type I restriction endonuclease [Luteolibacter pohnpeiensis]MBK1884396.1 hypothetical protein [Luteolibacter pohnpeiensis]
MEKEAVNKKIIFPPDVVSLENESDVEAHFLTPLLSGPKPLGLELPPEWIRTKSSLRAFSIGKGKSQKLYYPDCVIQVKGLSLIAIEVKTPGEDLDKAMEEARLYADVINRMSPSNVNPCQICVVSDGKITRMGPWDSNEITCEFFLESICVGDADFSLFQEACSRLNLESKAKKIHDALSSEKAFRPVSRAGGEYAQSQQIKPNDFGQILVSHYSNLFTPDTIDDRKEVAINAYVKTKRTERYIDEIERVVDQINPFKVIESREIQDTGAPIEVTSQFEDIDALVNKVMLLIGLPGAGKSTFVDHLQHSVFPENQREKLMWVRINFNNAPSALDELYTWTLKEVVKGIRSQNSEVQQFTLETLKNIFSSDIKRDLAYMRDLLGSDSLEYKKALMEKLQSWIEDDSRLIRNLELFLCKGRNRLLVIVCDNCDKRLPEMQLRVFEVVQWIKTQVRALVILPIRESTYEVNKDTPPLDTALKSLVYQINPPSFQKVLMIRIKLLLKKVKDNPPKRLSFIAGDNLKILFDEEKIASFLRAINRSLFNDEKLGKRLIQGLSSKNVRNGLEIFLNLCRSGYLPTEEVFYAEAAGNPRPFNESVTYNIFMRMDKRYYVGDKSLVKNLYHGLKSGRAESHFTRLRICKWLKKRLTENGPSGAKGFHRESELIRDISGLGHLREDVINQIEYLCEYDILIREGGCVDSDRLCCLSPSGYVHLELHDRFQYLGRCAEDSFIHDPMVADVISNRISGRETEGRLLENTISFCDYLSECKERADSLLIGECPKELEIPDFQRITDIAGSRLSKLRSRKWSRRF